jgi:crotonobetainyl-CoA:carnitine CoA-transferase CaiB-like acyl-CoA transferase
MPLQGLSQLRVLDFSSWIAGPYASKLFADAGADVIKVEAETGDPMRHYASKPEFLEKRKGDSAFFQYLNANKRSVTGKPDDDHIRELIASADLVIEDFQGNSKELDALNIEQLKKEFPHLVILSITPFGRKGPYADRPATEFTVQAEGGSTSMRGLTSWMPFMAGGRASDFVGATYAAVVAGCTLRGAERTGLGEHIDFSLSECMNIASTIYVDLVFSLMDRPHIPGPMRQLEIPSIEPTKDGWVGFNTNSRQQFDDFLILIEKADWIGDEELASAWSRTFRYDEWNEAVHAWTQKHETSYIIEQAALFRIPVAPVCNGKTVLEQEQFKARGVFEENPAGDFMQPRPPYRINGDRIRGLKAAPELGQHNNNIENHQPAAAKTKSSERELPLKGIRILDAAAWWAGPAATQMFATLGADVIHVESIHRFDGARTVIAMAGGDDWWERSHLYNGTNSNKRSLTLDLNNENGLQLFKDLVKECDVVIENFSPRVFEHFGLDWDNIHEINPQAIFVRMPAFGLDGPWRNHVGFAQTMEQMSGMAWVTGHVDDQPRIQRGPCDPLSGMHAAFAILAALSERDKTGKGQFLECTMVEGALNASAEQVIEYTAYGNVLNREGNRSPYAAPQGLYPCKVDEDGEEQLLALSIATDEQWQALVEILGSPGWATDTKYANHAGRREHHDELDKHLLSWAENQKLKPTVDTMLNNGIPAATLLDSRSSYNQTQFEARGFYEEVEHPVIGTHFISGMPFRFDSRYDQPWLSTHAPTMGQHNYEILGELLGQSKEQIEQLEKDQVIGNRPAGV